MAARGHRAIRRGHWRAVDRKASTGAAFGQRRAGARAGADVRKVRNKPRGRDRDHRFRRRFQESLNIMCNRGFQIGEGGQPDGGGTSARDMVKPQNQARETAENRQQRTHQRRHSPEKRNGRTTQESKPAQERGPREPGRNYDSVGPESPEGPQAANKPEFASAVFADFQGNAGVKFLKDNLSGDKDAFTRDGFAGRGQNCHRVSMRSPTGTPHNRCVGDVLAEEGRKVWAMVGEFGLVSGLCAVGTSLLCVRGADRDVEGGAGVAQSTGDRRSHVSARDEPRDLHLSRAVTGLSSCVYQGSDCVVSTHGLAHRAAGRVGRACA